MGMEISSGGNGLVRRDVHREDIAESFD